MIARLTARFGEEAGWFGGYDERGSAGGDDSGGEVGEGGDVGHAEGTPVASVVWGFLIRIS